MRRARSPAIVAHAGGAVVALLLAVGGAAGTDAQDIEILHYDLRLEVPGAADATTPASETIRFRSVRDGVDEMAFDAAGLTIEAVDEGGHALTFTHEDERLRIHLSRTTHARELRTIGVRYRLHPGRGLRVTPDQ